MATADEGNGNDTDIERRAEQAVSEFEGDALRGVGYYSPGDCAPVYLREDVEHEPTEKGRPLEDAVLESIAAQAIEDYFDDELVGTIRVFEQKVVIYACAETNHGVVVTFDRDAGVDYVSIRERLEQFVQNE